MCRSPRRQGSVPWSVHDLAASLEEEHVAPLARELAEALAPPDHLEAGALVHADANVVLREDPRLDRPDPRRLRRSSELLQEPEADPLPARSLGHVGAVLDDPA